MFKIVKPFLITLFVSSLLIWSSCSKDPFTVIEKIEVRTQGSFVFEDGLTLATKNQQEYELFVLTNTDRADIYYSINEADPIKLKGYWITVDSTANVIDFYSSSTKSNSENFRLNLGFENDSLLGSITSVYPNPTNDIITFKLEGETRGEIELTIYSVSGVELFNCTDFVGSSKFKKEFNVSSFTYGIYFLIANYGDSKSIIRFVKA